MVKIKNPAYENVKSDDPAVRKAGIEELARIADKEAIRTLIQIANGGLYKPRSWRDLWRRKVEKSFHSDTQLFAMQMLSETGSYDAFTYLSRLTAKKYFNNNGLDEALYINMPGQLGVIVNWSFWHGHDSIPRTPVASTEVNEGTILEVIKQAQTRINETFDMKHPQSLEPDSQYPGDGTSDYRGNSSWLG
jgi:hypothetical protein